MKVFKIGESYYVSPYKVFLGATKHLIKINYESLKLDLKLIYRY